MIKLASNSHWITYGKLEDSSYSLRMAANRSGFGLRIVLTAPFKVTLNSPCKPLNTLQQDLIQVVAHYDRIYAVMI